MLVRFCGGPPRHLPPNLHPLPQRVREGKCLEGWGLKFCFQGHRVCPSELWAPSTNTPATVWADLNCGVYTGHTADRPGLGRRHLPEAGPIRPCPHPMRHTRSAMLIPARDDRELKPTPPPRLTQANFVGMVPEVDRHRLAGCWPIGFSISIWCAVHISNAPFTEATLPRLRGGGD